LPSTRASFSGSPTIVTSVAAAATSIADPAGAGAIAVAPDRVAGQPADRQRHPDHLAGGGARGLGDLIDGLAHPGRGLAGHVDVAALLVGQRIGVARQHDVERAGDRRQRRAQLVGHHPHQLAVALRQVAGAGQVAQHHHRADQRAGLGDRRHHRVQHQLADPHLLAHRHVAGGDQLERVEAQPRLERLRRHVLVGGQPEDRPRRRVAEHRAGAVVRDRYRVGHGGEHQLEPPGVHRPASVAARGGSDASSR
jgi:hypothetical protein